MKTERIWLWSLIFINFVCWALLISGNLPLKGLRLTDSLISTAVHRPHQYDNSFIVGLEYNEDGTIKQVIGSSLEAQNIRATGGALVGNYILNEGQLTQHGGIVFAPEVSYSCGEDILGLPHFNTHDNIYYIMPDYSTRRIIFTADGGGFWVAKDGIHLLPSGMLLEEKIKKEILEELNAE